MQGVKRPAPAKSLAPALKITKAGSKAVKGTPDKAGAGAGRGAGGGIQAESGTGGVAVKGAGNRGAGEAEAERGDGDLAGLLGGYSSDSDA